MLTKLQKKHYDEIKLAFKDHDRVHFKDAEYLKYKDILTLLMHREIIRDMRIFGGKLYDKIGDFSIFDEWLKDQEKKERKLSFREWKIAIIGGSIGSIISFLPDIINFINSLFK